MMQPWMYHGGLDAIVLVSRVTEYSGPGLKCCRLGNVKGMHV